MQDILFCPRIPEGYMIKCHFSMTILRKFLRILGVVDQCMAHKDFIHTGCGYGCPWQHDRDHADH